MLMRGKRLHRCGALALSSFLAGFGVAAPARAQNSHPCAAMAGPAERLACYDKAFPPVVPLQEAVRERAQQDFGKQYAGPGSELGQSRDVADPDSIEAAIAKLEYANGRRVFTLDNGHVWTTVDAGGMGHAVKGDRVRVRKGAMGSYVLQTPAGVGLRVRRAR
jgi:hypothetical protein